MNATQPHYFLFSETRDEPQGPIWRFVLSGTDGRQTLEAADVEPQESPERLELLAALRGLEALDQPANVTLVTASRYLSHGLTYGVAEWRSNGWKWERFGKMVPVKNVDLWRRIDRALSYHHVACTTLRFDHSHEPKHRPTEAEKKRSRSLANRVARKLTTWVLAPLGVIASVLLHCPISLTSRLNDDLPSQRHHLGYS